MALVWTLAGSRSCRAAYLAPAPAVGPADPLPPEVLKRLRELGYLEDDAPPPLP